MGCGILFSNAWLLLLWLGRDDIACGYDLLRLFECDCWLRTHTKEEGSTSKEQAEQDKNTTKEPIILVVALAVFAVGGGYVDLVVIIVGGDFDDIIGIAREMCAQRGLDIDGRAMVGVVDKRDSIAVGEGMNAVDRRVKGRLLHNVER